MACLPPRQLIPERFKRWVANVLQAASTTPEPMGQPTQLRDHLINPTDLVPKHDPKTGVLSPTFNVLVPVIRRHRLAQMLAGMTVIHDARGVVIERAVEV